ncbi:MAG: Chitobiose ABC transporter, ATP-binding protein 1 [uncultured Thermomicrobiales bacterium]|uniref:Chitobiose ABC transporter, ATP-binding protein 1 n=1 Tax=uncultured Thermomicrobiales bacterium TaxID=1645740 RepID=A0A6J4U8Q5_9BACT|nr:MAG: Chitobiose ABC transporter, ATP-binding protein 1 [uncultured Thermomicrobiales bacterium]
MKVTSRGASQPRQEQAATDALIDIRDLRVEYVSDRGPVRAVDGVSLSIRPGEVLGLAGESGSGKSTIAQGILRILQPPAVITGGQVMFGGRDILRISDHELEQFRWRDVSMVFQSAMNALNPVMTIGDQIIDVIQAHEEVRSREARSRAEELLKIVGIESSRIDSYPHQLSGGMRQRAMIAIALALNPPLMIMDEPTTALDVVVQKEIMQQINELKERLGFSIIFITHDLSLLVEISDRIAIMYAGQIVELADARELFDRPLHPYTQGLMRSFPSLTGERHKLTGIAGSPPDLVSPPKGCRFYARCTQRKDGYDEVAPPLTEVSERHWVACHQYLDGSTGLRPGEQPVQMVERGARNA